MTMKGYFNIAHRPVFAVSFRLFLRGCLNLNSEAGERVAAGRVRVFHR
jgi:hypothetical protein